MNSYQDRIVSYEKIHSIDEKDFSKLIELINLKDNQNILDICCGYGSVSKRIIDQANKANVSIHLTLLDSSELQISRAKENLKDDSLTFVTSDAMNTPFENNSFDVVINKMGLHEVKKSDQLLMLKEIYRILKPESQILIWELALDERSQKLFQMIIHEKDRLAGFTSLITNRYFPKKSEILKNLEIAGFKKFNCVHDIQPTLSIRNRKEELISKDRLKIVEDKGFLEEDDELQLEKISERKIVELCNFIKNNLSDEEKIYMNFKETKNDVILSAPKAIFVAIK